MRTIKAAFAAASARLDDNTLMAGAFAFALGFAITWALL